MGRYLSVCLVLASLGFIAACDRVQSPTSPSSADTVVWGTKAAESNSSHPPGQQHSGNPAHAPGCSNPNTKPSKDCKN